MHDEATQTLQTLGMLYETAFGTERWPEALDAIARLIGGNGALLFVTDAAPSDLQIAAMSSRYEAEDAHLYLSSLTGGAELRWVHVLDAVPPRTLKTDLDVWPDRDAYDAMASVRFMRSMNLYHRVGVRPCAHGGWQDALTILFNEPHGGITTAEAERLMLLVPHVARAIEQQRPFKLLQSRFNAVLSVLNQLGMGVLILNDTGTIVVANDEAERVLGAADGLLRNANSRVSTTDAASTAQLDAMLRQTARAARLEQPQSPGSLQVPRRTRGEHYMVEIAPFRDDGGEMGSAFVGVLMLIVDPDHRDMVAVDGLVKSYGLTPTETQVCGMIARGMTLREIADSRSVSLDTVKSQSRSIYGKTRTRNRRELVQRAQSIAPPLLDRAGRRVN